MTFRPGYGELVYGTGLYGVTGAVNGSATAAATATTATSYERVREHAKNIPVTLSASTVKVIVKDCSASFSLQNAVVTVGEEYAITDGFRPGYGQRTYGTQIYGRNDQTEDGTATITATSSASASCERVRELAPAVATQLTTDVNAVYSILVSPNISATLAGSTAVERVSEFSATGACSVSISVPAIEKWEPVSSTPEIWTPVTWSRAA